MKILSLPCKVLRILDIPGARPLDPHKNEMKCFFLYFCKAEDFDMITTGPKSTNL